MKEMDTQQNSLKKEPILKTLKSRFAALTTAKKIQLITASVMTLIIVIGLPVYAWFALSGKIEAFTKIKEPDNLDIRAGHFDAVQYFDLSDIDIETMKESGNPHSVVFSVSGGDYKIPYKLQLAHTTNIPFVYRIYRANELTGKPQSEPYLTYVSQPLKDQGKSESEYTFYYTKKTKEENGETVVDEVKLTPKNIDASSESRYGRKLALGSGTYYNATYDAENGDAPEVYSVPVYEQSERITYDSTSEHDYFILEIEWDSSARQDVSFSTWNTAENKKETDMVYLTALRTE